MRARTTSRDEPERRAGTGSAWTVTARCDSYCASGAASLDVVDHVVEDAEGVFEGLVVGHGRTGSERMVVLIWSEGCACTGDGGVLVGPSGCGAVLGPESGARDAVEDGNCRHMVEDDQDLDPPPHAQVDGGAIARLMRSFESLTEVTRRMGKIAGAGANGRGQRQGQPEHRGARALARD